MRFVGRVLSSGKATPFLILLLSVLLMAPALIAPGATVHGDFYVYVRWQAHFAEAFVGGEVYPRWLPDLNQGFGSPAFFIYPPLGQWMGVITERLLPGVGAAGLRLMIALTFALTLSGLGTFAWLRLTGVAITGALVGAFAWLLLPYHAYLDLYQRGAFAELVAMSALPWGMFFAHAVQQGRFLGWAGLTISLSALLYANAPTALVGGPFLCLYSGFLAERGKWLRHWALVGSAGLVALALAGAWLGPALTHVALVNHKILFNDVYQPSNYLIFSSSPWPNQGVRIAATLIFLLHAGIFALVLISGGSGRGRRVLIGAMLLLFLVMTEVSRPFWAPDMPWSKIQFAWRLLGLQTLLLAGLIGMAWQSASGNRRARMSAVFRWLLPALLLIDMVLLAALVRHVSQRPAWPTREVSAPRAEVREYWLGDVDVLARDFGARDTYDMGKGSAEIGPLDRRGRLLRFEVKARDPALIAVRQFCYTGWIVRTDSGIWQPAVCQSAAGGWLTVAVPPGLHQIELRMPQLSAESRGILLSWVGLGLLLAGVIADTVRRLLVR